MEIVSSLPGPKFLTYFFSSSSSSSRNPSITASTPWFGSSAASFVVLPKQSNAKGVRSIVDAVPCHLPSKRKENKLKEEEKKASCLFPSFFFSFLDSKETKRKQ
jgi:hypothetical protein